MQWDLWTSGGLDYTWQAVRAILSFCCFSSLRPLLWTIKLHLTFKSTWIDSNWCFVVEWSHPLTLFCSLQRWCHRIIWYLRPSSVAASLFRLCRSGQELFLYLLRGTNCSRKSAESKLESSTLRECRWSAVEKGLFLSHMSFPCPCPQIITTVYLWDLWPLCERGKMFK